MKAQIILHDVSTSTDGFTIDILGGVGPQGPQGYSPVRGKDYWTEDDQEAVTKAAIEVVLAAYPAAEEVKF